MWGSYSFLISNILEEGRIQERGAPQCTIRQVLLKFPQTGESLWKAFYVIVIGQYQ